ncbi:MAG: hypothetical protein HDT32_02565 [Clostridiales bacterium]|nr:hypothetical protein [Clostridiales bacterium]
MKAIYVCKKCRCEMFDRPSKQYGRCPSCGHKLYPDGYTEEAVSDGYFDGFRGKVYPAPSWEEDLR